MSAAVDIILRVDARFAWADDDAREHLRETYDGAVAALFDMQDTLGVEPE